MAAGGAAVAVGVAQGAFGVAGTGFGFLSTLISYQQGLIALEGQQEQLGFQNDLIDAQLDYAFTTAELALDAINTQADHEIAMNQYGHDLLESQGAQVDAQQKFLNQQRRASSQSFKLDQSTLDSRARQESMNRDILTSQRSQEDSRQRQMQSQGRTLELQAQKNDLARALQKNDVKLARNAATQAARIESDKMRMINARGGASAFAKAYTAMTVNQLASFDQKFTALEQEGLIDKSVLNEQLSQVTESILQSRENQKQLDTQKAQSEETSRQIQNEKAQSQIDQKLEQAGYDRDAVILQEQENQLGTQGQILDQELETALATAANQRAGTIAELEYAQTASNIQTEANNAASENIEDQQQAAADPGGNLGWGEGTAADIGEQITSGAGQIVEGVADNIGWNF